MPDKPVLTPEIHKKQIEAYTEVRPKFVTYAEALKRVMECACQVSFPDAFVQARGERGVSHPHPGRPQVTILTGLAPMPLLPAASCRGTRRRASYPFRRAGRRPPVAPDPP